MELYEDKMSDEELVEQATAYAFLSLTYKHKNDPENKMNQELVETYSKLEAEIIKRGIDLDRY